MHHSDHEDGGRGIRDWNGEDTLLQDIKVHHSTFHKFSMGLQWNNPHGPPDSVSFIILQLVQGENISSFLI